ANQEQPYALIMRCEHFGTLLEITRSMHCVLQPLFETQPAVRAFWAFFISDLVTAAVRLQRVDWVKRLLPMAPPPNPDDFPYWDLALYLSAELSETGPSMSRLIWWYRYMELPYDQTLDEERLALEARFLSPFEGIDRPAALDQLIGPNRDLWELAKTSLSSGLTPVHTVL
ncbi:hypothetical protein H4R33_007114, partial [Dimargaris cristalligena]